MRFAVIMAGGSGTRLWPYSRRNCPKQFIKLLGPRSLLQATYTRIRRQIPPERILVVTHRRWSAEVRRQLPDLPRRNLLAEPAARNTAPCIALAMLHVRRRYADASMVVLPADQFLGDAPRFRGYLRDGFRFIDQHPEYALTLGITPTHPSTAYGYLQRGAPLAAMKMGNVETVRRFIEKPKPAQARRLVAAGTSLWNAGIFLWKLRTFEQLVERHMPVLARQLAALDRALCGRRKTADVARVYAELPTQSIDYGIMEKAAHVAVLPCAIPWNDVGSWSSLSELLPRDECRNVVHRPAQAMLLDVEGSIIHNEDLRVAAIGVRDLIVVQRDNTLLICPRQREQEIRALLEQLHADGKDAWL